MVNVVLLIVEGCVEELEIITSTSQAIRRYHQLIREHYKTEEEYQICLDDSKAEPLIEIHKDIQVK
jgi:prephenate dehydratase